MFEQFKELLVEEFQVEEDKITLDAELSGDLAINSIELAELILRCEETFGIEIQEDEMHKFVTVGDVVEYLNTKYSAEIEIEFIVIDWDNKEKMLADGSIDLVWNGMTITDERLAAMEISVPYLANKQVAIVKKADASKYGANKEEFFKNTADAVIVVEKGSAGEELVKPVE